MAEFKNIFVAQGHTYSIALGHFEAEFGMKVSATDEQCENYDDIGER